MRAIAAAVAVGAGITAADPASGQSENIPERVPNVAPAHATPEEVVGEQRRASAQLQERRAAPDSGEPEFVYRIGAEDVLEITVRGEEDLTRSVSVRPDGRITLPLVGSALAVGRTAEELQAAIAEELQTYIESPQVQVVVAGATGTFPDRIRIIGNAVTPRALAYRDGMTALDAITEIGGLPPEAAANSAYLLRGSGEARRQIPLRLGELLEQGRLGADRPLAPGDIIVVPRGFFSGDWEFEQSLGASVTYTDNINLAPSGLRDDAIITELAPGILASLEGARVQGALDAEVRLQFLSETDIDDFTIAPNVAGTVTTELFEDLVFTDLAASVSRSLIDTQRNRSFSQANVTNQRITQSYRWSPYIRNRLGRFATVESRYIGELVLIDRGDEEEGGRPFSLADDSFENTARLEVESGAMFGVLDWTLTGIWTHIDLENRESRRRREATLRLEYPLSPSFTLIGIGGYEQFEGDDFSRDIDDPVGMGGFRWSPSPATELEALGGFDDGDEAFRVDFRHDITQSLSVNISYNERAEIDQERLTANLPRTIDDLDGFEPNPVGLTLTDDPTRLETLDGQLQGEIGSTLVSLSARYQKRELSVVGGADDEEIVSVTVGVTQPLPGDLVFSGSGTFQNRDTAAIENIREATEDDEYFANARLSFTGFRLFDVSLGYSFSKEDSTRLFRDFRENAVTFGITASF